MIWWWVTMLLRSIIICWLLVALGHTFILEQPGGSAFRHFPQWRFFCKYIAVDSWDWHQIFCYFFGDDFKDVISNSRTQDDMQKHAANCKPKHCQCGTSTSMSLGLWSLYTKNIFIRFFFFGGWDCWIIVHKECSEPTNGPPGVPTWNMDETLRQCLLQKNISMVE